MSANGLDFHVAELGEGRLILLLHGFPQFWWCWRDQLPALAAAGFRAVAVDLRGYGASDKPPRGYDAFTLSSDVAGLVRALGEQQAVLVGHDWGGVLGWLTAALHPRIVRRLAVLSMPHPLRMRAALAADPRGQLAASRHLFGFQLPGGAARLVADDAASVAEILRRWGGPDFPYDAVAGRYRSAVRIPGVARSALEYYRWALGAQLRPSGARLVRRLRTPITVPTLQLHGALDTCTLPSTALGSSRYVAGSYDWRLLDGVGHFPAEERPADVAALLADWAGQK